MNIRKFVLFSIYFLFLAVVFEASARFAFAIPQLSKILWQDEALSWRRSWINRHRRTGLDIYYTFDVYDPYKGWMPRPSIKDMSAFKNKVLNTNSRGIRGKIEYSYNKNKDRLRILILGDSFTFGDEVSDDETYPYYLQQMMPRAEVLNLGVHGYGHDQMLIYLEQEGIKYKPDIIILGFVGDDMSRNMLDFRDYAKPKFILDDNKKLRLTGTPVAPPWETLKWDWARPRIADLASLARRRLNELTGSYEKEEKEVTTAVLSKIIATAAVNRAIPIFVYLPRVKEIASSALTPGEGYLFNMCQTSDAVSCFSVRSHFADKIAKGVTFKEERGRHWGPEGHLAAAEAIKDYLLNKGLYESGDRQIELH